MATFTITVENVPDVEFLQENFKELNAKFAVPGLDMVNIKLDYETIISNGPELHMLYLEMMATAATCQYLSTRINQWKNNASN